MKNQKKILVLLSGGADSATSLALAVQEVGSENVCCLNAYYGQRLDKEMDCAKKLTEHYGVEYLTLDISSVMEYSDCSLLKASTKEIEHKTYREQMDEKGTIDSYVPFRNGVFFAIAASIADSRDIDEVWIGTHGDDYAYPDCSPEFLTLMKLAIKAGTANDIRIFAPLQVLKKKDIIKKGLELGVPYEITWSCYEGGEKPCGKCASCIDRINAFRENGAEDPTYKEEEV